MAGLINELIDILNQQNLNYDELLAISREKKNTIINNDVETLQKMTIVENMIVSRNQKLEDRRIETTNNIANVLNQNPEELSLDKLADLIKEQKEYDELNNARNQLRKTIIELKEINDTNNLLLKSSMDYIDFSINLVRSAMDENPSYHSSQNKDVNDESGFFDAKK